MVDTRPYGLAARAEIEKLLAHIDLDQATCDALATQDPNTLRGIRQDMVTEIYSYRQDNFLQLARRLRLLSVKRLARLAVRVGPILCARIVSELDPYIATRVARRLDPSFLAEVAANADPEKVREVLNGLPADLLRDAAMVHINQRQFTVLGAFADALAAPAIRQIISAIKDDAVLLKIAFYMEDRDQLAKVIRLLDNERVSSIVRCGTENSDLWPLAISIVDRIEGELKGRLGNIMVTEDDATLNELIDVADSQKLWGPVLRALTAINARYYRKVVNLPGLRNEAVLNNLVLTAYNKDLLVETLPLVKAMHRDYQKMIAHIVLRQDDELAEAVMEAAHAGDQWDLILDLAQHLNDQERDRLAALPAASNSVMLESLLGAAVRTGKASLVLDFAKRLNEDALRTVAEISLRNGGDLLESLLNAARTTQHGWDAVATAVAAVNDDATLSEIAVVYHRQNSEDQHAFQEAASKAQAWERLSAVINN